MIDPTQSHQLIPKSALEVRPQSSGDPQVALSASNETGSAWKSWNSWDWSTQSFAPGNGQSSEQDSQRQSSDIPSSHHQLNIHVAPGNNECVSGDQYSNVWDQTWDDTPVDGPSGNGTHLDRSQAREDHQKYVQPAFCSPNHGHDSVGGPNADQLVTGHLSGETQQQLEANTDNQEQAYHHYVAYEQHNGVPSYFEQSYDADVWSVASINQSWSGHYPDQQREPGQSLSPTSVQEEVEVGHSQATVGTESIPQVSSDAYRNSDHTFTRPTFQVFNSDDDTGTASGFFNQDEDDGDVQRDTHKHSLDGGLSREPGASSHDSSKFLAVARPLHRSNSEISNASLATLNLSMDEDEDQEPLHNIQELIQRMAEVDRFHGGASSSFVHSMASGYVNVEQADPGQESILDQDSGAELGAQSPARQYDSSHTQHSKHYVTEQNSFVDSEALKYSQFASTETVSSLAISAQVESNFHSHPSTGEQPYIQNRASDSNPSPFPDQSDSGITITVGHENLAQEARLIQNARDQSLSVTAQPLLDVLNSNSSIRRAHSDTLLTESATPHESSNQRSRSPCVPTTNRNDQQVKAAIPLVKTSLSSSLTSLPQTAAILALPKKDVTSSHAPEDLDKSRPGKIPDVHQSSGLQNLSTLNYPIKTANSVHANHSQAMNKIHTPASNPPNNKLFSSPSAEDGNCVPKPEPEHAAGRTAPIQPPEEPPIRSSSRNSDEIAATNSWSLKHHSQSSGRSRRTAMSPATTLWDNTQAPTANILLAPILPLIIPNLHTQSSVTAINRTDNVMLSKENKTQSKSQNNPYLSVGGQEPNAKHEEYRGKLSSGSSDRNRSFESSDISRRTDKNRSYDSLDELDAVVDRQRERREYSHRHNGQDPYKHDSYRQDLERPASKTERPLSRSGQYRYERPLSRAGEIQAREDRHRHHGYYGDYGNSTLDERYDRPRSGQDDLLSSRPSSRSSREIDQHKSKSSLDRSKDYYYKDRSRGYSYNNFGRQMDYSQEDRERYYRYYQEKDARYNRGYYEEYYGAKHADYLLGQQQHPRRPRSSQSLDRSDSQLPQQQQRRPHSTQSFDRSSPHSQLDRSAPPATSSPKKLHSQTGAKMIGQDYYGHRDYHSSHYPDYYNQGGYPYRGYGTYFDSYGYDPYIYGYHYPTYDEYIKGLGHNQGRMTPPKYLFPHVRASFGPAGQLIKVLPNRPTDGQPAVVEVQDVHGILEDSPEADELKSFPGPLTRTHTHKKDVLLFCQQKARHCADNMALVDRDSAQLIWNFLALLIKQNGSVVGTDLSDLLLEGHEPSTHDYNTRGLRISQSPEMQDSVTDGNSDGSSVRASPAVHVTSDRTVINSFDREMEKWIDRFRNLLFYGRKKDALECAMKNHLWGHALFLASKMDARTHANVMTRFANSAIRMNDPLQTLYQLMSGRQPAAVTGVVDERWGDWRPHLAMILSNQTSRLDLDRKSLTTLGDTLAAKGCLHASHFCYLMAQVNFGSYTIKTSKIVLVGSSHSLPLQEFATNEAIQCTEVYEYAQSLNNPDFCLPHFQIFKYLYACRLADYGMVSEALQYCEVIAGNIQKYPRMFHSTFVQLVHTLSSKLKYFDPQRQISADDAEDAAWLQQLANLCASFDDGSIRPMSDTPTQTGSTDISSFNDVTQSGSLIYSQAGNSTFVASNGDWITGNSTYAQQLQENRSDLTEENYGEASRAEDQTDGGVVFDQHQQQQALHIQEQSNQMLWLQQQQQQQQQQYTHENYYPTEHQHQYVNSRPETNSQLEIQPQQHFNEHPSQQESIQQHPIEQHQQYLIQKHNTQLPSYYQQHPTQQHPTPQHPTQHPTPQQEMSQHPTYPHQPPPMTQEPLPQSLGHTSTQANLAPGLSGHVSSLDPGTAQFPPPKGTVASTQALPQAQLQQQNQLGHYDNQWSQHRSSVSATDTDEEEEEEGEDAAFGSSLNGFDYFGSAGAQQVVTPPHRYRHMSGSSTGSVRRKRTTSESSTSSIRTATHRTVPQQQQQQAISAGRGNNQITQAKQQNNEGSGWLGGLFNKFKARGKNEMILPDDKNPSIVWDPVKKKWMNADGTEEEQVSTAPPPKDIELKGPGRPISYDPTPMASGPPPPPASGANRFSLKAKGNRGPYVDVTKPKPVSVPADLFNLLPGTPAPAATDGHNALLTSSMFHPASGRRSAEPERSSSNKDSNFLAVPGSADQVSWLVGRQMLDRQMLDR